MSHNFAGTPDNVKTVGETPEHAKTFTEGYTDSLKARIEANIITCRLCLADQVGCHYEWNLPWKALLAVLELHKPDGVMGLNYRHCSFCDIKYSKCRTIQAIEKELG